MSEPNEDREALASMLADALVEETPGADVLLRYASDPNALEPAERTRVEEFLAASPAHRQQLRSLVRFVEARTELAAGDASEPAAATAGRSDASTLVPIASHPRCRSERRG